MKTCLLCPAEIPNRKQYCPECKVKHRRKYGLARYYTMKRVRDANRPPSKCQNGCGKNIEPGRPLSTKYCRGCAKEIQYAYSADWHARNPPIDKSEDFGTDWERMKRITFSYNKDISTGNRRSEDDKVV